MLAVKPPYSTAVLKGLYMKHLQAYLSYANDPARTVKYQPFITAQASAIASNALNSTDGVSSLWYSPDEGGAVFSGQSDSAGLAALLSAAQVCSEPTFQHICS